MRRKEHKVLIIDADDALKGTNYLWLKNPDNWSDENQKAFKNLQTKGLKMGRAWAIKETFNNLWEYTYQKSAKKFFDEWYWWATHSRLDPIIKVAKMLKRHLDNILTYLTHRQCHNRRIYL